MNEFKSFTDFRSAEAIDNARKANENAAGMGEWDLPVWYRTPTPSSLAIGNTMQSLAEAAQVTDTISNEQTSNIDGA